MLGDLSDRVHEYPHWLVEGQECENGEEADTGEEDIGHTEGDDDPADGCVEKPPPVIRPLRSLVDGPNVPKRDRLTRSDSPLGVPALTSTGTPAGPKVASLV